MDENAILCIGILASKNVIFYQNKHLLERLDLHYLYAGYFEMAS